MVGAILDGDGFVVAFESGIRPVRGQRVLVVGSGGVGSLLRSRWPTVVPSKSTCRMLTPRVRARLPNGSPRPVPCSRSVVPEARDYDLAVNASPAGMRPTDPLPIDLNRVTRGVVVADVVTKPVRTRLLQMAAELQDGRQMIAVQIPLQAKFFGYAGGDRAYRRATGLRT